MTEKASLDNTLEEYDFQSEIEKLCHFTAELATLLDKYRQDYEDTPRGYVRTIHARKLMADLNFLYTEITGLSLNSLVIK
jgi:hypothetical protein